MVAAIKAEMEVEADLVLGCEMKVVLVDKALSEFGTEIVEVARVLSVADAEAADTGEIEWALVDEVVIAVFDKFFEIIGVMYYQESHFGNQSLFLLSAKLITVPITRAEVDVILKSYVETKVVLGGIEAVVTPGLLLA